MVIVTESLFNYIVPSLWFWAGLSFTLPRFWRGVSREYVAFHEFVAMLFVAVVIGCIAGPLIWLVYVLYLLSRPKHD